jgi:ubiquinone/menaquinone biosynthesis C-methylase UbiE
MTDRKSPPGGNSGKVTAQEARTVARPEGNLMRLHFVEDYERLVLSLLKQHSLDEAMSRAVGGDYETIGRIEVDILRYAGLREGMSIVDIGCGSGRLASSLTKTEMRLDYLGTDVIQKFIDYAAKKSSKSYKFKIHRELTVPVQDETQDIICAFSVFTHLHHHETFLYVKDMYRALKRGGRLVFSFLEFAEAGHWQVFEDTCFLYSKKTLEHLNTFIERPVIALWSQILDFDLEQFIGAKEAVKDSHPLGQTVAILVKG